MALDDLFMIVHNQTYVGRKLQNVYFYEAADPSLTAVDMGQAFELEVVPAILAVQGLVVKHVDLNVTNLGNLGDNSTEVLNYEGQFGDVDCLPAFNAINYTLKPSNRVVRPGSKRICGVPESVQAYGIITDATYITALNALRVILGDPIINGGEIFNPVVIKRVKEAVEDTDPVEYTYRLPTIGETPVYSSISACLLNLNVSSQVSRKT